jgi:hypothetical protein
MGHKSSSVIRLKESCSGFIVAAEQVTGHETHPFVAEFARASDAVCAALRFQPSNTEHNAQLANDIVPVVRIGIALDEEVFADDTVTRELRIGDRQLRYLRRIYRQGQ